ncbi:MAG: hypothetical protein MAG715_00588 [Methanonatronarchaeales archaeon]|nr:hypothetical protein [Methanonatronarchaeales archaeon]
MPVLSLTFGTVLTSLALLLAGVVLLVTGFVLRRRGSERGALPLGAGAVLVALSGYTMYRFITAFG